MNQLADDWHLEEHSCRVKQVETATNTGSAIEGEGTGPSNKLGHRPLDWRKNPEIKDWLLKTVGRDLAEEKSPTMKLKNRKNGQHVEEMAAKVPKKEPEVETVTPLDVQSGSPVSQTEALAKKLDRPAATKAEPPVKTFDLDEPVTAGAREGPGAATPSDVGAKAELAQLTDTLKTMAEQSQGQAGVGAIVHPWRETFAVERPGVESGVRTQDRGFEGEDQPADSGDVERIQGIAGKPATGVDRIRDERGEVYEVTHSKAFPRLLTAKRSPTLLTTDWTAPDCFARSRKPIRSTSRGISGR